MKVILPGSYDPVTIGHLDLIRRAAELYDEVMAVIFVNPEKVYRFTAEERLKMLSLATEGLSNVTVDYSEGLVIDYMRAHGASLIVKGYRNDADLEYEKRQADWNKAHGGFDTVLWKCRDGLEAVSSTAVRNALCAGGCASELLPEAVAKYILTLEK